MQPQTPDNDPPTPSAITTPSQKRKRRQQKPVPQEKSVLHLNHMASRWALLPVILIVWLAPFLGGSTETWAIAIIFLLLALLFTLFPVTFATQKPFRWFLLALTILPLFAFLPISLTGIPTWRTELAQFSVPFPSTISPQPWLTFDVWLTWLGAIAWIYWLSAQGWTREMRKPLAELFAAGVIVITIVGLVGYYTGHPLPIWHAERHFGPFANRNQTANLLALTFIVLLALLHMAILKKSRLAAVWAVGMLLIGWGVIVNFSKSGIILPALGTCLYWSLTTLTAPSRKKIWVGVAFATLVVAFLLAFGGETLDRFNVRSTTDDSLTNDFRLRIFSDTWTMIRQHPIFGLGLGNFQFVYPLFRKLAGGTLGIIHPESDWLWLASDVGAPAASCVFLVAICMLYGAFRAAFKRPHPLRLASAICGALFIFHGFFDVSGHRFGTLFPACFLFALCWPGQMTSQPITPWISRSIALVIAIIACGWLLDLGNPPLRPGFGPLATIKESAAKHIASGMGSEALRETDAALRWAPLDWELYYQRGTGRILTHQNWGASLLDYQLTNRLERFSPIAPDHQGISWISYRPELAALPWAEALKRTPTEERDKIYARYLEMSARYPRLRAQLEMLGSGNIAQSIIQLNDVEKERFPKMLADFQQRHPNPDKFSPADQRSFLDIWAGRGNPQDVINIVNKMPGLLPAGTVPYASAYARIGNYQTACHLLLAWLPVPKLPNVAQKGSEADMDREFHAHDSLAVGLALYKMQIDRKDNPAALSTIMRLERLPDAPKYLLYYHAKILVDRQDWENAWGVLVDYLIKSRL